MLYSLAADAVLGLHALFLAFVVLGALLAVRWPGVVWAHIPAVVWGALIEFRGWICPLTPLENRLRRLAGQAGYAGGFIEHYITPLLYPSGLTREIQLGLGVGVLLLNAGLYWWVWRRRRARRVGGEPGATA